MIGTALLSVDDVLTLHAIAVESQGGDPSLHNRALLESAVATPAQQFGGQYVHPDIPAMAAAYAFHICRNHPFLDGNKRSGTAAMIAFLSDNGWSFDATVEEAEPVILSLAAGAIDKTAFTDWARQHMHEKPRMELRDFFARVKLADSNLLAQAVVASGSESEARATSSEAATAIPLIHELQQQKADLLAAGEAERAQRVEFGETLLITLVRIAEDMGYEW